MFLSRIIATTVTVDCKLTNVDESLVVAAFDRHESIHCHINHDHDHDYNWLTQPVCSRRRDLLVWKPAKDFSQSCSAWGGFLIFQFSKWVPNWTSLHHWSGHAGHSQLILIRLPTPTRQVSWESQIKARLTAKRCHCSQKRKKPWPVLIYTNMSWFCIWYYKHIC